MKKRKEQMGVARTKQSSGQTKAVRKGGDGSKGVEQGEVRRRGIVLAGMGRVSDPQDLCSRGGRLTCKESYEQSFSPRQK